MSNQNPSSTPNQAALRGQAKNLFARGKTSEAHRLLAEAMHLDTEGADPRARRSAKALLAAANELDGPPPQSFTVDPKLGLRFETWEQATTRLQKAALNAEQKVGLAALLHLTIGGLLSVDEATEAITQFMSEKESDANTTPATGTNG